MKTRKQAGHETRIQESNLPSSARLAGRRWTSLFLGALIGLGLGAAGTVWAGGALKTYTTRGTLVQASEGKVVLKDKFGQTWEYAMSTPPASLTGKQVKVLYSMSAVKVDAE